MIGGLLLGAAGEHLEDALGIIETEALPVVADGEGVLLVAGFVEDLDTGRLIVPSERDRVLDEVLWLARLAVQSTIRLLS